MVCSRVTVLTMELPGHLCGFGVFADRVTPRSGISSDLSDSGDDCSLVPRLRRPHGIFGRLPLRAY